MKEFRLNPFFNRDKLKIQLCKNCKWQLLILELKLYKLVHFE
jgi:hypothetical protein